jgi:hypothetical protein
MGHKKAASEGGGSIDPLALARGDGKAEPGYFRLDKTARS